MGYIVQQDMELEINGRKKKFKQGIEYQWDVYIKTNPGLFKKVKNFIPSKVIVLDCGTSADKQISLLWDFDKIAEKEQHND